MPQCDSAVDSIFISIASYRDPQLVPTIRDCLAKASHPGRLTFGICWQHADEEKLPQWLSGDQFAVWDVHWSDSRGACWARAGLMERWTGQDWYLQLDSHHRFVPGWDTLLLHEAACSGSPRPVLSTYAPAYSPDEAVPEAELDASAQPTTMEFDAFLPDGIPLFRPRRIPVWNQRDRPRRARFLSAHFAFAPGEFVRDVPYDPELYFLGEEITLAVRAFTSGYDLFEPSRTILWHEYTRARRRKHWEDHTGERGPAWHELDARSRERIRGLLSGADLGQYGLGDARSIQDYESFAGINFRHQVVQDYTRYKLEPPNPPARPDWPEHVNTREFTVSIELAQLPPAAVEESPQWCLAVYTADGTELYRQAIKGEDLATASGPYVTITVQLASQTPPSAWTVLPCNEIRQDSQQLPALRAHSGDEP